MRMLEEWDKSIRSSLTHIAIDRTYLPVQGDKPTLEALSTVLYSGEAYQLSSHDPSGAANEVFIAQWNVLIKKLNVVLKIHLGYRDFSDISIQQPDNTVMSLEERLTCEITNSIRDKKTGLLPNQLPIAFTHLKRYLEEICFYFITKEKNTVDIGALRDLAENLHMCGPGLFQDSQATSDAIYKAEGLYAWLMECRTEIVRQEADLAIVGRKTPKGWEVHVTTAFFDYAKKQGWQLSLGDIDLSDAYSVNVAHADDLNNLKHKFKTRYSVEAIPYLVERTKAFLREQFFLFSEHDDPLKISLLKLSEFLEKTKAVLSSLGLSEQLFLEMNEECTYYTLKLSDMDAMIREGLSKIGLIPLAVNVSVSGLAESVRVFIQNSDAQFSMVYGIKNNASIPPNCVILFLYKKKYYTPQKFIRMIIESDAKEFLFLLLVVLKKHPEMRQFRAELISALLKKKIEDSSSLQFESELQNYLLPKDKIYLSASKLDSVERYRAWFADSPVGFLVASTSEDLYIFFQRSPEFKATFIDCLLKNSITFDFQRLCLSQKFIDLVNIDNTFLKNIVETDTGYSENVKNSIWILFYILNGVSESLSNDIKKSIFFILRKIYENKNSRSKLLELFDGVILKDSCKLIDLLCFFEKNPSLLEDGSIVLNFVLDRDIFRSVIRAIFKFSPNKLPILFFLAKNKTEFLSSLYFEINYFISSKLVSRSRVIKAFPSLSVIFEAAKLDANYLTLLLRISDLNKLLETNSAELIEVLTLGPARLEILGMESPKYFYDLLKHAEKKPDLVALCDDVKYTFLTLERHKCFVEKLKCFLADPNYTYSLPVNMIKTLLTLMRNNTGIKESVPANWAVNIITSFSRELGVIFDKIMSEVAQNNFFNKHDIKLVHDYLSSIIALYEFKDESLLVSRSLPRFFRPDELKKEILKELYRCVENMFCQNPCCADIKKSLIKLLCETDQDALRFPLFEITQKLLNLHAKLEEMHVCQCELSLESLKEPAVH